MKTPELICRGNSFDVGAKHGLLLKEAVQSNLANFWSASQALGLERFALVQKAKKLAQEYTDALIEEIKSVATGASVDLGELLAFNLCHGEVFPDECSVLFAMGDATASGNTLFLKNSDKIGGDSMEGPNFYKHKGDQCCTGRSPRRWPRHRGNFGCRIDWPQDGGQRSGSRSGDQHRPHSGTRRTESGHHPNESTGPCAAGA